MKLKLLLFFLVSSLFLVSCSTKNYFVKPTSVDQKGATSVKVDVNYVSKYWQVLTITNTTDLPVAINWNLSSINNSFIVAPYQVIPNFRELMLSAPYPAVIAPKSVFRTVVHPGVFAQVPKKVGDEIIEPGYIDYTSTVVLNVTSNNNSDFAVVNINLSNDDQLCVYVEQSVFMSDCKKSKVYQEYSEPEIDYLMRNK